MAKVKREAMGMASEGGDGAGDRPAASAAQTTAAKGNVGGIEPSAQGGAGANKNNLVVPGMYAAGGCDKV